MCKEVLFVRDGDTGGLIGVACAIAGVDHTDHIRYGARVTIKGDVPITTTWRMVWAHSAEQPFTLPSVVDAQIEIGITAAQPG